MRPQRNAAENGGVGWTKIQKEDASMRPQRNAAENLREFGEAKVSETGFNEAAA